MLSKRKTLDVLHIIFMIVSIVTLSIGFFLNFTGDMLISTYGVVIISFMAAQWCEIKSHLYKLEEKINEKDSNQS